MQPHEIKPDTGLCTILGHNAQTGYMRRYFNKIMKTNQRNATAIALNINEEHFDFTMRSVGESKVDKMMIEKEFNQKAMAYCDSVNPCGTALGYIDFIEVKEGKVYGFCLEDEAKALFENQAFLDEQILFVAKMILLANRWFDTPIDKDTIPMLIGDTNA